MNHYRMTNYDTPRKKHYLFTLLIIIALRATYNPVFIYSTKCLCDLRRPLGSLTQRTTQVGRSERAPGLTHGPCATPTRLPTELTATRLASATSTQFLSQRCRPSVWSMRRTASGCCRRGGGGSTMTHHANSRACAMAVSAVFLLLCINK